MRLSVRDGRLLTELASLHGVSIAYVGAAGDPLVPAGVPVIRAGELSNADIIAAMDSLRGNDERWRWISS